MEKSLKQQSYFMLQSQNPYRLESNWSFSYSRLVHKHCLSPLYHKTTMLLKQQIKSYGSLLPSSTTMQQLCRAKGGCCINNNIIKK